MFNILPWNHPNEISIRRNKAPLSSLQNEMNRLFDDFFNDGFRESSLFPSALANNRLASPAVDIVENEKSFKVEAELPGMDQDDVEVTINDNYLTVKGDKKTSREDKEEDYIRRERYYGSYQRTIALPETADVDQAKANFKKGVLWVDIPKKEEAVKSSKKLEIQE